MGLTGFTVPVTGRAGLYGLKRGKRGEPLKRLNSINLDNSCITTSLATKQDQRLPNNNEIKLLNSPRSISLAPVKRSLAHKRLSRLPGGRICVPRNAGQIRPGHRSGLAGGVAQGESTVCVWVEEAGVAATALM
jgi:hypothetical protein